MSGRTTKSSTAPRKVEWLLRTLFKQKLTAPEIADTLSLEPGCNINRNRVDQILFRFEKRGIVAREGRGRYYYIGSSKEKKPW
jgi:predicted transcriptional regulator of viral defense system